MPDFLANIIVPIVPGFIADMVARGFWWAILANLMFQMFLSILRNCPKIIYT